MPQTTMLQFVKFGRLLCAGVSWCKRGCKWNTAAAEVFVLGRRVVRVHEGDRPQLLSHLISTASIGSQEPSPLEKVDREQCQSAARRCSHSLNVEGQRFESNPRAFLRRGGHFSPCLYLLSPGSPVPSQSRKRRGLG